MAQTTSLVFNGGVIPSPSPAPSGNGKAKLLKIGEITVTEQEVQVTKKVICDPDSVTTVAPFMEVLTSAKLAELVESNSIIVLDDGDMQYLMANANITVEEGIPVCTAVNFLGLSNDKRAKVAYNCTRIADELTLQQVVEVGEPVETDFNLVITDSEDTAPNTLIDKMEVVSNEREPDEPTILQLEATVDGQGNRKVAINEDNLRTFVKEVDNAFEDVWDKIGELPSDEHGYFNSSIYQTPGDGTTESLLMDNFRISQGRDVHGDSIEFVPTHQEDGVDFGEVYLNPGTYILNVHYTLQYVGNPRGTFHPLVTNVGEQPFDFSYEHEDILRTTRIVTRSTRGKFGLNFPFDKDTPPMGIWVKYLEIAQIASYTSPTVIREATQEWLDNHPEASTTVQDNSLTEAKFTDTLKLHTIKDYATPEMFGAKGDGVTDDTNAFTAMVAASSKYLLTKNYVVSGVVIDKTFNMLGLPGCSLSAANNTQEYILRLDSGNGNCIVGVRFEGKGSSFPDARGNVVGVLLNAKSSYMFLMERCTINYCKIGLFAPKTFWHSKVSLCMFNGCGTGISINSSDGNINQTYLELLFSQIYCNQCDLHVFLHYGSNITFNECSFGSEHLLTGSKFFRNNMPVHNLVFRSCNFEGIFISNGRGAFELMAYCRGVFEDCQFHVVSPVQGVSPNNVSLFYFAMSGDTRVSFRRCRFDSISIDYMFDCPTGTKETFEFDYNTIAAIGGEFSRRFDANHVYPASAHVFNISEIPLLSKVPSTTPWNSNLNKQFKGTVIRINLTSDFYMWDGSSWVKLMYVPQPPSDTNTYTLKNVSGTLTWVQDT